MQPRNQVQRTGTAVVSHLCLGWETDKRILDQVDTLEYVISSVHSTDGSSGLYSLAHLE